MATRYAEPEDLPRLGVTASALVGVSLPDQERALDAASAEADSYLRARYRLPLTAWGDDLRQAVVSIAVETLLAIRGHNPAAGRDDIATARAERARAWLRDVAKGVVIAEVAEAPSPTEGAASASAGFSIVSRPRRGW